MIPFPNGFKGVVLSSVGVSQIRNALITSILVSRTLRYTAEFSNDDLSSSDERNAAF